MQRKVFDVLCHLVENRGRVVTKAELLSELWRNEHVNEGAVAWSVSHIRRALGQQRGDRQPIETVQGRGYRFIADVDRGQITQPAPRALTPVPPRASNFVGRARVMTELEQQVREAARGHGGMCVLTGEAGIGKTRCADELAALAGSLGVQTLVGRCPQEPAAPPLWPIAAALRAVAEEYPELAERARELLTRNHGDGKAGEDLSSSARFWLIERAAQLLRDVAATRPTLLILDDLHWADATSLGVLGFIAQELRELPLCIVVTLRDGERQPSNHEPLQRLLRHAHTIPLRALDGGQVAELVEKLSGQRPTDALAEAVRRAAGGIPLFVQEVVRSLMLEHGAKALGQLSPEAVRPPELARDLLRQRIHRLPSPTISLLSQAAVIGDTFDLSLLLGLVELEPDVLLDRLEPAIAEEQLESDAPHTYRFVHSLFQAVLYDDLLASERVAIHRKAAALLAARTDEEPRVGEIARHLYLSLPAGDYQNVVQRAREAGAGAMQLFAFEDASRYYTWALEAQAFGGGADPRTRVELLLSLASAQRYAGRTLESVQTTARVLDLAQQHRFHDAVVRATRLRRPAIAMWMVPDDMARSALEGLLSQVPDSASPVRVSALAQLACIPPYDRDLARSKELSMRAVALANELGSSDPAFEALRARLFALSGPDDIDEVLRVAETMVVISRESGMLWRGGDALSSRYLAYVMAGRMTEADATLDLLHAAIVGDRQVPEPAFYCARLKAQRSF
ncbi:MAG TPA: AAA family ATPase, partial [Polyangiales bacterium]|nr:AAA family ATPase [Polyangiales bacterium]